MPHDTGFSLTAACVWASAEARKQSQTPGNVMFLPPRSPRRIHNKGVMRWEAPRSAKSPAGENPACVRVSHPRRTKPCVEGGDELGEARGRDVLGRNASECIEPRKTDVIEVDAFIAAEDNTKACALARRHLLYRGSEATAWYEMGSMCTWEICWILPDPEKSGSTTGQVERDEERRRVQQKSDWLRVLGAWESHVQGEAASNETSD